MTDLARTDALFFAQTGMDRGRVENRVDLAELSGRFLNNRRLHCRRRTE